MKFIFGKYRGDSYEEVAAKDGRYLLWLRNQEWISPETKDRIENVLDQIVLSFGRHSGKTLLEVSESDPKYHTWLLKQK
jgi:uncharacterized protein (DUF3820 family)